MVGVTEVAGGGEELFWKFVLVLLSFFKNYRGNCLLVLVFFFDIIIVIMFFSFVFK